MSPLAAIFHPGGADPNGYPVAVIDMVASWSETTGTVTQAVCVTTDGAIRVFDAGRVQVVDRAVAGAIAGATEDQREAARAGRDRPAGTVAGTVVRGTNATKVHRTRSFLSAREAGRLDHRVMGRWRARWHPRAMHPLDLPFALGKRVAVTTLALALMATPFASAAEAAITKPFQPKSTVTLAPGIKFAVGTMKTTGGRPQSVRVGTIETGRGEVRLKSVLSNDLVVKRDVVTNMAKRKSRPGLRPMVATNGDMSMRNRVDAYAAPHSMAVSNGELLLAQACSRPTLGIDPDGEARIGEVRAHVSAVPPGKVQPKQIHRVNTHRDDGLTVLFTKRFASSTRTAPGGIEIVLDLEGILRPNGTQRVRVLKIRRGLGNTPLRPGQAVLSVRNPNTKWVYRLRVGQRFDLTSQIVRRVDKDCGGTIEAAPAWARISEALGGNHFTARNHKIAAPSRAVYPSGSERHPRTGVGVTDDGRVLMVTVDGRRTASRGVTLAEMGQLMRSLGARHAFNLDGGGSTVMARRDHSTGTFVVSNRPSDGRQRPATQALVAFKYDPDK